MQVGSLSQHLITVMADGVDQSKFKIPKLRGLKLKAMDRFPKPAAHVGGVWVHGHCLQMHACMPDVSKDANLNIESISRALDSALEASDSKSLPPHLWLQQDNAPNQCKNQKMFKWCIYLVMKGVQEHTRHPNDVEHADSQSVSRR
jgi:hypothetical protein